MQRMSILIANIKPEIDAKITIKNPHSSVSIPTLHFPINLGLIAAVLKNEYAIKVIDNYATKLSYVDCLKAIVSEIPKYLLITGYLGGYSYKYLKKFTKDVRNAVPEIRIIMGGPMATTIPELILKYTDVDIVVIGEGEATIVELMDHLDRNASLNSVKGIAFKTANKIVFTGMRERIKTLDMLPRPAYELFPIDNYLRYLNDTGRCWELSTSRGCYGSCTFCKLTFGRRVTFMSPEKIVEEMCYIYHTYGIDRFNFVNDNFLINESYIIKFCDELKKCGIEFKWRFQGRADRIDGKLVHLMKSAGLFGISFGLESGSVEILKEMNKKFDLERVEKNVREVIETGIIVHASFIVGMPSENEKTIEETMGFIKRTGLRNLNVGILTPFPGTEVYSWAKKMGKITDDDAYCEELGHVYEYPYVNMTKQPDDKLLEFRDMITSTAR